LMVCSDGWPMVLLKMVMECLPYYHVTMLL
jgi:hypothetical protein